MSGLEKDTIGGFNSLIQNMCKDNAVNLTTVLFDDQYEILWNGVDATTVKLTEKDYYVRGMTALYDAIGKTITRVGERLSQTPQEDRPQKVIVVITTDGYENASREFNHTKIKQMIEHQQNKYNWEFIFMAANIDTHQEAQKIGIKTSDALSFQASEEGVEAMYACLAKSINDKLT